MLGTGTCPTPLGQRGLNEPGLDRFEYSHLALDLLDVIIEKLEAVMKSQAVGI